MSRPPTFGQRPTPPMKTPVQARQGVKGHNVRYVLIFGLLGAVVAMAVAYFFFFPPYDHLI